MKMSHCIISAVALVSLPSVALLAEPGEIEQSSVTRAELESRVKDRFAMADANKDGIVEKVEIEAARKKSMADRQDAHFKAMDTNSDGSISRAEFDIAHAKPSANEGDAPMHGKRGGKHNRRHGMAEGGRGHGAGLMFARADANKDGRLTLAEALVPATERFDTIDTNKDGILSPAERKTARETRREKRRDHRG